MTNTTNNRVDARVTPETVQTVKNAIDAIHKALPFLTGLTAVERKAIPKISVSNKVFTEDAIQAAVNNPNLAPGFIDPQSLKRDLDLFYCKSMNDIMKVFFTDKYIQK